MIKSGTITFHWATNYGAVLQTYALQKVLENNSIDNEVIRYEPLQAIFLRGISRMIRFNLLEIKKEYIINRFRRNKIKLSKKIYFSNKSLRKTNKKYNLIITGSDQVLNFSFVRYAEFKNNTWSYYLNFTDDKIKRISYAVSFGTNEVPDEYKNSVKNLLSRFSWVGVRENSANSMLLDIGIDNDVVLDPTLLLPLQKYNELIKNCTNISYSVFPIVLNANPETQKCISYLNNLKLGNNIYDGRILEVEQWLNSIKKSKFVVTDSFHATVFSIIFHTPFVVFSTRVDGTTINMNDRLTTLLHMVDLEDRFVNEFNKEVIDELMYKEIEWDKIDKLIERERTRSINLLLSNMRG